MYRRQGYYGKSESSRALFARDMQDAAPTGVPPELRQRRRLAGEAFARSGVLHREQPR